MKTYVITITAFILAFFQVQAQQVWTQVWQSTSNNSDDHLMDVHFSSQNTGYVLGTENSTDSHFILKTTDGGQNWNEIYHSNEFDISHHMSEDIFFSDTQPQTGIWIISTQDAWSGYTIYRTVDGAQTWTQEYIPGVDGIRVATIKNNTLFVYAVEIVSGNPEGRFYTSTDYGSTWNLKYSGNQYFDAIFLSFVNDQTGFAQTETSVYKTTDGGNNWTYAGDFQNPNGSTSARDFVFKNGQVGFSGGAYNEHFMKTMDSGQNWTPLLIDNGAQPNVGSISLSNNAVYASSSDLYRSLDTGVTWLKIPSAGKDVVHLFDEYNGVAIGYDEIYLMDTSSLSVENPAPKIETKVYPNPAENILHLEIPGLLSVQKVRITDIQGKTVKEYPGNARQLDVSNLAAGNYFLQAETNQGKITKKVIVK